MAHLKYPLVCFDLDGTLVDDTIYIWKTLHETFQTNPVERQNAYDDYFAGRITYQSWFEHDLKLLKAAGANRRRILDVLDTLTPMNGAKEALSELKSKGHRLAVISGSLDIVVSHLFDESLFDAVLINKLHFYQNGQISGGVHTPYDLEGKARGLQVLAEKLDISLSETVFVGDNENDVWVANSAGFAIAFNCKSNKLRQICDVEVTVKDLRAVAELIY